MANNSQIDIQVVAKDLASNVFESIKDSLDGMGAAGAVSSKGLVVGFTAAQVAAQLALKAFDWVVNSVKNLINGAVEFGKQMGQLAVDTARRGGQIQDVFVGFEKNFEDNQKALKDLREAAQGTISDYDLMLSANKASMLGVTQNSEEMADLLEIARGRAQALGLDSTQAFEDIVTGIGRMSPLILDNLGITTAAYKEQLEIMEANGKEMTTQEKQQLLLKTVLEDQSQATYTLKTMWQQFDTTIKNAKDNIASGLVPIFTEIGTVVMPFVQTAVENLSTEFVKFATDAWPRVKEAATEWKNFFIDWWAENKVLVTAEVERLTTAITGEDGLLTAIWGIIDPSEESKKKLGELMTEGVQKLTNTLIGVDGKGGLVGAAKETIGRIQEIDEQEWESITTSFTNLANSAVTLADAINSIATAWETLKKVGMISSRVAAGVATGGLSEVYQATKSEQKRVNDAMLNYTATEPSNLLPYSTRATGGLASGLTMIGERGAELLNLPSGTRVQTAQNSGGAGNITINVNAPVTGVDNLKASIIEAVNQATARQNKLAGYNLL